MKKHKNAIIIIIAVMLVVAAASVRIYYGEGIGLRIVFKNGPAFRDTLVNVDDMRIMPRITLASNHTAVKRQLEKMEIFESDAKVQKRIRADMKKDLKQLLRELGFLTAYYLTSSELEAAPKLQPEKKKGK